MRNSWKLGLMLLGGVLAAVVLAVAQAPVNLAQLVGTVISVNSGNKDAGTLRVVLATDQPALTNKLLVTPDANVKVNIVGNAGANVDAVTGAAVPANAVQTCGTDGTNCTVPYIDPCQRGVKTYGTFSITANTQLFAGTSAKKTYMCEFHVIVGAATNVAVVSGTGSVCATGITAFLSGGTTAAGGWNLSANGGLVLGSGGFAVGQTANNADNVCILVSAANQTSGSYAYVTY